jgi:hydroxyacylglutathione hydrolase
MGDHRASGGVDKPGLRFGVRASAETVAEGLDVTAVTDEGLGNTSWLLALDGQGVVVDPARDTAPYEKAAEGLGVAIALAAETHLHADFVTGTRELGVGGASVVAPVRARLAWPHEHLADGGEIDLGRWRLRALATPGHTPEHLAYLLTDKGRPRAVFTGGSLLVGAVARTDLIAPDDTEGLTRDLWRSINHQLLTLPDDVAVLPTHGAGSFCAAADDSAARWTTIGRERRANPLLQADNEDDFVRQVLAGFGSYPPYFGRLREVNRLGPVLYGAVPRLPVLGAYDVAERQGAGALVIDVRSVEDYAAGHLPGSLAITLRPQFASWLGWLVADPATPLVFVTDTHTDRRELVRQCLNIGYENLAGEMDVATWTASGLSTSTTRLVGADELGDARLLDVRQDSEFGLGHIPGAHHVELGALTSQLNRPGGIPPGPLVTACGHGERATSAASLLEAAGHEDVAVFRGGPGDWSAATGEPLTHP